MVSFGYIMTSCDDPLSFESFGPYHRAITARIGFLIVPLALTTLLNVLLLWWRPPSVTISF